MQSYYPYCWWILVILVKSNWNWSVLGYPFAGFLPLQFTHRSPSNWWVFRWRWGDLVLAMNHHFRLKKPTKKTEGGTLLWHSAMNHLAASMANLTFNTFQMSPWDLTESYLWKPTNLSNKLLKGFQGSFRDNNSVETPPFTKLPSLAKLRNQGHTPKNNTSASDGW